MSQVRGKDVGLTKVGQGTSGSFAATRLPESDKVLENRAHQTLREALVADFPDLSEEQITEAFQVADEWQRNNPWGTTDQMFESLNEHFNPPAPEPAPTAATWHSQPEDLVFAAVGRDSDSYIDELRTYHPDLPIGRARSILKTFAAHVEKFPESNQWKKSFATQIAEASAPRHPSVTMSPGQNELRKLAATVKYSAFHINEGDEDLERYHFHAQVPHLSIQEADKAFDEALARCKAGHRGWEASLPELLQQNSRAQGQDFDFNYQPPGFRSTGEEPNRVRYGALYQPGMSISEINKNMRVELKRAQHAGFLPRGVQFSVRKRSAGSIHIDIIGVEKELIYRESPYGRPYTEAASQIRDRVNQIASAWQYDGSDRHQEIYNMNYSAHATFEE